MANQDMDRINWNDDDWPVYEKARGDGYKAWNGKADRLHGTDVTHAAYDIVKQAVNEHVCDPDGVSQHGYYIGSIRGLRGEPVEGEQY